jgi:hypothetical protein
MSTTKIDCVSGPAGQTIPDELSNLQQLRHLDVCGRNLAGTIPESILHLKKLSHLALCNNGFTGQLPFFGGLSHLRVLDASNNALNGSISTLEAPQLSTYRLENNQLVDTLPRGLARMTLLEHLSVENNQLWGTIPNAIYAFTTRTKLTLAGNPMQEVTPPAADWDKFNSDVAAVTRPSPHFSAMAPTAPAMTNVPTIGAHLRPRSVASRFAPVICATVQSARATIWLVPTFSDNVALRGTPTMSAWKVSQI